MKTKHLLIISSLAASSLAIASPQAWAGTFLIDSFDVPTISPPGFPPPDSGTNPLVVNTVGQTKTSIFTTGVPTNEVIGGQRQVTITQTSSTLSGVLTSEAAVITGSGNFDGILDIQNNSRTNSRTELLYDQIGPGQQNFNVLSGADDERGIKVDYFSEGIPFNFQLLISDGMNVSSVTKMINPGGTPVENSALFTFDEILAGGAIDLSMVNYVQLIITGNQGFDLQINQIGTFEVPEPSTILGLLTVLGTGAWSLKRKNKE
jgi:hypothetical protein